MISVVAVVITVIGEIDIVAKNAKPPVGLKHNAALRGRAKRVPKE